MHSQQCTPYPCYHPQRALISLKTAMFKLRAHRDSLVVLAAPEPNTVALLHRFTGAIEKRVALPEKPTAMEVISLGTQDFLVVGTVAGRIHVKDCLGEHEGTTVVLERERADETYVNDIVHSPAAPSILLNCFNNGSIAVSGVLSGRRLHTFPSVHSQYTYKLRMQNPTTLVSCGSDGAACLLDLGKGRVLAKYWHPGAVWCASPISDSQLATVGLGSQLMVWDIRAGQPVQVVSKHFGEGSFITTRNQDELRLFYGDGPQVRKWDRRQDKSRLLSKFEMVTSCEAMLFWDDMLYVCGRGNDLCYFKGSQDYNLQGPVIEPQLLGQNEELGNESSLEEESDSDMVDESSPMVMQPVLENTNKMGEIVGLSAEARLDLQKQEAYWIDQQQ